MAKEYIEREAVCYQLEKQETIDGQPRAIRRARRIVEDYPAADAVEVRHGKWESYQQGRWIYARCSECNTVHDTKTSYCPSCGARMDLKDGDGE